MFAVLRSTGVAAQHVGALWLVGHMRQIAQALGIGARLWGSLLQGGFLLPSFGQAPASRAPSGSSMRSQRPKHDCERNGQTMTIAQSTAADVAVILSHRHDQGADWWTTPDRKLLKGAPFTTLESALYLMELGVTPQHEALEAVAQLIFDAWRDDGRIKTAPSGGLYPCHTALAANVLCRMGYGNDARVKRTLAYFLDTQRPDGGWRCEKYSFGHGEETQYSTPYTTLVVLDLFRQIPGFEDDLRLDRAVAFLLAHWVIRRPISPCHYGIGSRFMQVEYPMRGYGLFSYVYVLSFYARARSDERFQAALEALSAKTVSGEMVVERVVPKLSALTFCRKGCPSAGATARWREILQNIEKSPSGSAKNGPGTLAKQAGM